MRITLWMLPNHMRPSHSIKALKKGLFTKPASFRDRVYLTDAGEALLRAALEVDPSATLRLVSHSNYLITRADIAAGGLRVGMEGFRMGRSSWSSGFRVTAEGDQGTVRHFVGRVAAILGRDPVTSPYWGEGEWGMLQRDHKLVPTALKTQWSAALG